MGLFDAGTGAAAQTNRKKRVYAARQRAKAEAERLAEQRELQRELERTGTNRVIEERKRKEREAAERRAKQVRYLIQAGSTKLLGMGQTTQSAEQYQLAEMAAMCFAEALDVGESTRSVMSDRACSYTHLARCARQICIANVCFGRPE